MKKKVCLWIVCLGGLLTAGELFAVDAPFSTAPAPTQVYHSVSSNSLSSAPQSAPVVQASAPAPASTPAPDMTNGAAVINSVGVDTSSQGQVSAAFEQHTDQSIQNLDDSNRAMSIAIQSINQNMTQLQTQVAELQSIQSNSSHLSVASNASHIMNQKKYGEYLDFGGTAVFMLGFGVVLGRVMRRRSSVSAVNSAPRKRVSPSIASEDDTKNEYDFMETAEAIPAKLDLARSYMAMNEYEKAHGVLKTVMEIGNETQRIEAQLLINKMNSGKNDK